MLGLFDMATMKIQKPFLNDRLRELAKGHFKTQTRRPIKEFLNRDIRWVHVCEKKPCYISMHPHSHHVFEYVGNDEIGLQTTISPKFNLGLIQDSEGDRYMITGHKIEKLHDISHEDLIKEFSIIDNNPLPLNDRFLLLHHFHRIWDEIYGETPYKWEENPFVFAYDFVYLGK